MKRHVFVIGALLLVFATSGILQAMPRASSGTPGQAAVGELLVKFVPGVRREQREAAARSAGGQLQRHIDDLDIAVVRIAQSDAAQGMAATAELLNALELNRQVEYAQPNYIYTVADAAPSTVYLPIMQGTGQSVFTPNDPFLNSQYAWGKIGAYQGWTYDRGSNKVVVAIVDTGVQLNHPDLSSKLVAGYDFVDSDASANDTLNGHGTHVAGTIGAVTDNGIGVAGTCPNCMLMPVRVLNGNGSGYTSDVAEGIRYAANQGAKVINLSLGGTNEDRVLEDAVNYAWAKGAVVACAAGNEGHQGNPINYPAFYTNCLAVGAVDMNDVPAYYSQYGTWVDIAAPGSAIYSTFRNSGYQALSGTSMATPHVAGVAGILAGQGLTNQQIRDRIQRSADAIDETGSKWSNGRLNLLAAVRNQ